MGHPKFGMHYQDVKKQVKRIVKNAPDSTAKDRLVGSLINQAVRHEGEGARNELYQDVFRHERSFSGAGNKQKGWGSGKLLGGGRWKFEGGKWTKQGSA